MASWHPSVVIFLDTLSLSNMVCSLFAMIELTTLAATSLRHMPLKLFRSC
jgi:hypothetical protein